MTIDTLMTIDEVADRLRVSVPTVWRLVRSGRLPVARIGGTRGRPVRVAASSLEAVLQFWARTPVEEQTA